MQISYCSLHFIEIQAMKDNGLYCFILYNNVWLIYIQRSLMMAHAQTKETVSVSINIRARAGQRDLIDQAAERLGRSRSDFMLEAACREAENVLLDQAFFTVDAGTFAKFQALLDQPLPPTDKLRRLLKTRAPWEK
jgi:uncharacterized protein (DUF1778 family)